MEDSKNGLTVRYVPKDPPPGIRYDVQGAFLCFECRAWIDIKTPCEHQKAKTAVRILGID